MDVHLKVTLIGHSILIRLTVYEYDMPLDMILSNDIITDSGILLFYADKDAFIAKHNIIVETSPEELEEEGIYIFPEEYYIKKNTDSKGENLINQDGASQVTKYGNITIEDKEFKYK